MKKWICSIIFSMLSTFIDGHADNVYGYMSYSTSNVGDDIQGIAAQRLLPKNCIPIDREFVSEFGHSEQVNTIMNGWFMHTRNCCWWSNQNAPAKSWPPSAAINPLLVSIHFTQKFFSEELTEEGIEYLKAYGPVGVRDNFTLRELEARGIPCYFSGCLTLTLENPYKHKRNNVIYAVDLRNECINYIKSKTKQQVVVISHEVPSQIQYQNDKRLAYAEKLLDKYRQAKCVVTSRLHATMPCLAFETPVLFLTTNPNDHRFEGVLDLMHHCTAQELISGEYDFDFNEPAENPKTYLPVRKDLKRIVTEWFQKINDK